MYVYQVYLTKTKKKFSFSHFFSHLRLRKTLNMFVMDEFKLGACCFLARFLPNLMRNNSYFLVRFQLNCVGMGKCQLCTAHVHGAAVLCPDCEMLRSEVCLNGKSKITQAFYLIIQLSFTITSVIIFLQVRQRGRDMVLTTSRLDEGDTLSARRRSLVCAS